MIQSYILHSLNFLDTPTRYDSVKDFAYVTMWSTWEYDEKAPIGCYKDGQDMYRYQG